MCNVDPDYVMNIYSISWLTALFSHASLLSPKNISLRNMF